MTGTGTQTQTQTWTTGVTTIALLVLRTGELKTTTKKKTASALFNLNIQLILKIYLDTIDDDPDVTDHTQSVV